MDKKIVLLVDDEQDMLYAIKMQLEASGFEVTTAQDGQEALDKVYKDKPDLIVLDLMLPKIHGYKVCRMLKFDEKYKDIPIVMFTARAQESDVKLGYEVGADSYITKLQDPQALLAKVQELIKH